MTVRVAAARVGPRIGQAADNLAASVAWIERAAAAGAQLVVLPELATSGYVVDDTDDARAAAESIPGRTTAAWARVAAERDVVVVGGVCEVDDRGAVRNSAVAIDADGSIVATYRKLHLWGREKLVFVPGDARPPVADTAVGRIGICICYDLWFPELVQSLARDGAEILACPSNLSDTPADAGLPHVDVIVAIAAAHQQRMHLVLADRCHAERGAQWLGAACVVDAAGHLVAPPPAGDAEALAIADIDPAAARDKSWGPHNDLFGDRRPDVFR